MYSEICCVWRNEGLILVDELLISGGKIDITDYHQVGLFDNLFKFEPL